MWSVSTQSVSHDIIDRNPSNEPPRSQSRYQAVLTSLCDYTADNNNGMCDKQWCRIPQKALASETLVTLDEFAKRPVRVTVLMMSLWRIHGFSFSRELITSDWHRPRHWGICATADTGRCTGQCVLRWWANNITVFWRDAGPTILLSLYVTEGQQYYCLSTWHWAKYYCLSTWHWANNITISTLGQQCYCLSTWRLGQQYYCLSTWHWAKYYCLSTWHWANNITVSPRDVGPTILLSLHVTLGQQYYCLDTEPIILPSLHVTLGQQYYCLSTWRWAKKYYCLDAGPTMLLSLHVTLGQQYYCLVAGPTILLSLDVT